MHLCLGVPGSISSQPYKYLPSSCCDDINNRIHLSNDLSFTKCFTSIHPVVMVVVGPLLLLSSHFTVEKIEAQRGCPRSVTKSAFELE